MRKYSFLGKCNTKSVLERDIDLINTFPFDLELFCFVFVKVHTPPFIGWVCYCTRCNRATNVICEPWPCHWQLNIRTVYVQIYIFHAQFKRKRCPPIISAKSSKSHHNQKCFHEFYNRPNIHILCHYIFLPASYLITIILLKHTTIKTNSTLC